MNICGSLMDIYDEKKQRASPTPKEVIHEKSK